jgi:hypothetical protein
VVREVRSPHVAPYFVLGWLLMRKTSTRHELTALVDQADDLEALAARIQRTDDDHVGAADAQALTRAYQTWFGRAVFLLPEDLATVFHFEFEGNFFQARIKLFLQDCRRRSVLYEASDDAGRSLLDPWQYPFNDTFRGPLLMQKQILINASQRLGTSEPTLEALDFLDRTARRLPYALAALRRPYRGHEGTTIADEYDLQHFLLAVLCLHFEDVREEEYSPSRAGGATRIDFTLRDVRVAIETKMTRVGLGARQLGEEIAADWLRYQAHPDAGALFVLVYDPERRVSNSTGFERDFESDADAFPVRVVIVSS